VRKRQHLSLKETFKGVTDNVPGAGNPLADFILGLLATAWYYIIGVPEPKPPRSN
jgi:hypothetical protein